MSKQYNIIKIERLVFVCKNLDQHFTDKNWQHLNLTAIRKNRNFILSRYLVLKNIMFEFLELSDASYVDSFAFGEEWKVAEKPLWVGIGLKVECLEDAFQCLKKHQIIATELFISQKTKYVKGFADKSGLLNFKIQKRFVYLTEYDQQFEKERNSNLYGSDERRAYFPNTNLPSVNMPLKGNQNLIHLDEENRLCLDIVDGSSLKYNIKTDWLVLNKLNINIQPTGQ